MVLVVAAAYYVTGRLGVRLAIPPGVASPVWLSSGVAAATVLLWGKRIWPGIWLGSLGVNAETLLGSHASSAGLAISLGSVAAIATGSTLQALLVGYLARRFIGSNQIFERVRDVLFFAPIAMASCLVAATIGATALTLSGFTPWNGFGDTWLTWWLGDLIGILLVTPLVLLWSNPVKVHWRPWRLLEASALVLLLILVGQVVFGNLFPAGRENRPLPNLLAPLIVWAAIRFGPRGVVLSTALISAMAIYGRLQGWGPFGAGPLHVSLLLMQIFVGVALVTSLLLATAFTERRASEQALRESRESFRALADSSPVMVWQSGLDRGCHYFNTTWLEFTGRSMEEELGDGWTQGVHPDDLARCLEVYSTAFGRHQPFEMEYRLRHRSGQYRWIMDRGTPRFGPNHAFLGYIGGCIDIDDRKRAEEAQRAAETQLRLITDAAPALISYVDAQFRYRLVNQTYQRWFGQDPAQLRGRHVCEVLGEETWEEIRPYMARALAGETVAYEQELPYESGGTRWVHVTYTPDLGEDGRVRGFVVLVHDVSAAKRAEEALRESEERFRAMADGTPLIIWVTDPAGRIQFVNRAYSEFFGTTLEEVQRQGWQPLIHPEDAPTYVETFFDCLRKQKEFHAQTRVQRVDGEWRWVTSYGKPRFSPSGQFLGIAGSSPDVTERKQSEEALQKANAALAEADRRKDEFLAMLAHELRNPLAPIRYAAQMLCLSGLTGKMKKQCDVIDRQISHMGRLLDDLLDVSRITQGKIQLKRESVDLQSVVEQAVDSLRPMIEERGQHLRYQGPGTPLPVDGDPTRLEQVIRNLLHNAHKYTAEGGCIGVSTGQEVQNGQEWAVICVYDSGAGIAAELLGRVFEPFVQAEQSLARTEGGLGIGLAMVKRLVQMHGGSVEAQSEGMGRGSEFIVRLPLAQSGLMEHQTEREVESEPGHCRVLVVDDNADAAASLGELLGLWGHDVRTAFDGPKALATAREWRPEVILLDIGLPGMDGYEVARHLREEPATADAFVVALTGYGAEDDQRRALAAGFNQHLTKPVEIAQLQMLLGESRAA